MDDEIKCDDFNLKIAVETSALIDDFEECWDLKPVQIEIKRQQDEIRRGDYVNFRRQQGRRGSSTGVEDRHIIRGFRERMRKSKIRSKSKGKR